MTATIIPFNRPHSPGNAMRYIGEVLSGSQRHGGGPFTRRCQDWLEDWLGGGRAFLTQSCTAALEMAALLCRVGPGDEVIMPSFTFVSTANAFVLRGATPVFADIDPSTQNLDPVAVAKAVTSRTRAIVAVHYGGIGCDMEALAAIADRKGLILVEDAAQAIMGRRSGRPLGSFGALAAFSFHDSKNVSSGEGGALIVNDPRLIERAEILWEKGTNRSQYMRAEASRYTWLDVGSSFLPSEVTAALLLAQLEEAEEITAARLAVWNRYHAAFAPLERQGMLTRPAIPGECRHNGHLYYLMLPEPTARPSFIAAMAARGITTLFHYVPLHGSPAGMRFGRVLGPLPHTERAGACLVRLPLFPSLSGDDADRVAAAAGEIITSLTPL